MTRHCPLCAYGGKKTDNPAAKFAVWLHGLGWLVDTCGGKAAVADRLWGATWFKTEDEAREVLRSVAQGVAHIDEAGAVVTL